MNDIGVTNPKKYHQLIGGVITILSFILYFLTLAPTVLEADAGEFQFVAWLPGIAHPTGYPFYVLLGWFWSHLFPLGEVAWRMNLLSALLAAGAVGLTYLVSRQMVDIVLPVTPYPARLLVPAITALTFAATPTFWSQAIIAEVYALHALFVALILWLTLNFRAAPEPHNKRWGFALAFSFGLALTHHVTTILLLPALLVYLWLTKIPSTTNLANKISHTGPYLLIAMLPLLLYASLPLLSRSAPYTTLTLSDNQHLILYENSWQGWLQHITGTVFTSAVQPAALEASRFEMTAQLLAGQIGWLGIFLAVAGLLTMWQQRCIGLLALTGLAFVAMVIFNLIYFIGDVFVLFIPAWLITCLWLGLGLLGVSHWVASRFVQQKTAATDAFSFGNIKGKVRQNIYQLVILGFIGFFFAWPLLRLATTLPLVNQRNNTASRDRWQQIFTEPIPNAAILMSNDRNEIMPMWYYQYVENRRPDLVGLFPEIVQLPAYDTVGGVLDQAFASGRPVYFIKPVDDLAIKADLTPAGTLVKATPPELSPTHPLDHTFSRNSAEAVKLLGFDTAVLSPQEVKVTLFWQPAGHLTTDYTSYVHLLGPDGTALSQSDHRPGGSMYPSSQWRKDEILRDQHHLSLASPLPSISSNLTPGYRLRIGLYHQPQPGVIVPLGDTLETGQVAFD